MLCDTSKSSKFSMNNRWRRFQVWSSTVWQFRKSFTFLQYLHPFYFIHIMHRDPKSRFIADNWMERESIVWLQNPKSKVLNGFCWNVDMDYEYEICVCVICLLYCLAIETVRIKEKLEIFFLNCWTFSIVRQNVFTLTASMENYFNWYIIYKRTKTDIEHWDLNNRWA